MKHCKSKYVSPVTLTDIVKLQGVVCTSGTESVIEEGGEDGSEW